MLVCGLLQPLPGNFRWNDVTSGHYRSPEVTSRDFLSCDCLLLQATALWEVKPTVYSSFRHSTATSRWFPVNWCHLWVLLVTWGHVTSFPVTWLVPPASNSLVWSQTHRVRQFCAFYSHFQVTSVEMTSLAVTSGHLSSCDVISSHGTAYSWSYSLVLSQTHSVRQFSAFYSHFQVTSDELTSLPVTSGQLRSRDVISCHGTASCEQQPCRNSNARYTPVFGLLQPLPGDFWSNDVTSGSLPLTWGHATSFSVTWLPPPASYSLVESQAHRICQFSAF